MQCIGAPPSTNTANQLSGMRPLTALSAGGWWGAAVPVSTTIEILRGPAKERYGASKPPPEVQRMSLGARSQPLRSLHQRPLLARQSDRLVMKPASRVRLIEFQAPPAAKELDKQLRGVQEEKRICARTRITARPVKLRDKESGVARADSPQSSQKPPRGRAPRNGGTTDVDPARRRCPKTAVAI